MKPNSNPNRTVQLLILTFVALAVAASFVVPRESFAATRTVCLRPVIHDERTDCPTSGTGVRRVCNPGSWVDPVGFEVELWDKDSGASSNDEFIGAWILTSLGQSCITFEWENASYSQGELNPDVYFVIPNRAWSETGGGDEALRIVEADSTLYPAASSRGGWGGDADAGTALECETGANCYIASGNGVYITSNSASDYGQALMALDSAQRVLAPYTSRLDNMYINIEYPTDEDCPTACAPSRSSILVPTGLGDEGFRLAHEMGHIVQQHEFNQDGLRDDVGGGWTPTSVENDSGAVTEGWATYVGAVAWWDPNNSGSSPSGFGYNYETASPWSGTCANNRGLPLQSAKAFWDLDDANNEAAAGSGAGGDTISYNTASLSAGWDNFADGTSNRQDFENNVHGVNAYDYDFNSNVNDETLFDHNCIGSQQP